MRDGLQVEAWAFRPAETGAKYPGFTGCGKKRALSSRAKSRAVLPFPRFVRARDAARDLLFERRPPKNASLCGVLAIVEKPR